MARNCFVPGCDTGYKSAVARNKALERKNPSLFGAPKEIEVLEKWRRVIPRKDKIFGPPLKVCELHFDEDCLLKTYETKLPDGTISIIPRDRPSLKPGSIPTKFPTSLKWFSTKVSKRKVSTPHPTKNKRRPSSDPSHPDYVPSIFSFNKSAVQKGKLANLKGIKNPDPFSSVKMRSPDNLSKIPEKAMDNYCLNKNSKKDKEDKKQFVSLLKSSTSSSNTVNLQDKLKTVQNSSFLNSKNVSKTYSRMNKENKIIYSVSLLNSSSTKDHFSYKILSKNLSLIKKPNNFWGISPHSNVVICARWSRDYVCEKKVVIENSLNIRAFFKDWEIDLSKLMNITCIDDLSSLLEKIEQYKIP